MNATEPLPLLEAVPQQLYRVWWRLEVLFEKWRMHMAPEVRVDTDYNPSDDDMRMLLKGMHRLLERGGGNHYHEGGDGDGDNRRMLAWILTVTSLLAVAAVTGAVVMYGEVSSLRATVTQWQISSDRRQDQIERKVDLLESRSR